MADSATTFSVLSNDAPNVWIADQMYRLAERNLRLGKYATKYQVPQRMGKTLRIVRYKRLNLPTATLTEGTAPDAVALSTENVDVTLEQWGIVVLLTDVAEITTKHPALQIAINRTALAISEVLEREMAEMLLAGTSVYYPGTATTRATIGANDKLDTATVLKATVSLRNKGAAESEGGLFSGVIPAQAEGDILSSDQTFKDASNFANVRKLEFGEIGVWMGVRWARSNFLPIFKGVAAPGTQAALVAGFTQAGSGGALDGTLVTVVGRDVTTDYERIVSQTKTIADTDASVTCTTPTSTNYVYDIYMTDTAGANSKVVFERVAANTAKTLTAAIYTAGTSQSAPAIPASGREVFTSFITGVDGYGRVELNGMSLASYITPAGASYSNPLAQGRKVGTKIMWKSFIIDNNYFARVEAASAFSAELPA